MLLALPLHPSLFGRLRKVRNWLSQTDPDNSAPRPDEAMEKELRRLAETSPHLLPDIGFTETKQRQDGKRVFRRGGLRFEV